MLFGVSEAKYWPLECRRWPPAASCEWLPTAGYRFVTSTAWYASNGNSVSAFPADVFEIVGEVSPR